MRLKLTDKKLAAFKSAKLGTRRDYLDALMPGLLVRVTDKGSKTFMLRARYPGSPNSSRRALGKVGALSVERRATRRASGTSCSTKASTRRGRLNRTGWRCCGRRTTPSCRWRRPTLRTSSLRASRRPRCMSAKSARSSCRAGRRGRSTTSRSMTSPPSSIRSSSAARPVRRASCLDAPKHCGAGPSAAAPTG